MAIKEIIIDNKVTYDVSIGIRSRIKPKVRVQMLRRGIPTLKLAQLAERELIRDSAAELARREGTGTSWGEVLEKWELYHRSGNIVSQKMQLNTLWDTTATLRKFTSELLKKTCQEISPSEVKRILVQMEKDGYSKSRMKAVKSGINVVFKWGIEEGHIENVRISPGTGIELGKIVEEKPPQILSLNEIHNLLDHAKQMNHEWYPIWAMALNTGMRSGELYALTWEDIDFENKLITVSKSYNGRLKTIKSTKAGYWRKVPINLELDALLIELRAQRTPEQIHVLPRINQWKRGEAARILREFCVGIGIHDVCFHALRACFATHLLNAGVTSPVVKKICGWTDEKVMSRYIRLAGIDVAGATENLGFIRAENGGQKLVNMHEYRLYKGKEEK